MGHTTVVVSRDVHEAAKRQAEARQEPLYRYIDRMLRAAVGDSGPPEPLHPDAVADLVAMIAAVTGEEREACLRRLMSWAVLTEFAWRCCK
jgi:hypothetical protein